MLLEIVIEDASGGPMSKAELNTWADAYGLQMPVLSDKNSEQLWNFASDSGGSVGLPFTVLIDRGMVIESNTYPSHQQAERLL